MVFDCLVFSLLGAIKWLKSWKAPRSEILSEKLAMLILSKKIDKAFFKSIGSDVIRNKSSATA